MTLPLASVGFVNRSPTATWWFPLKETQNASPRAFNAARSLHPQACEGSRRNRSLQSIVLALFALGLAILFHLTRQHDISRIAAIKNTGQPSPARSIPYPERVFERVENWPSIDDLFEARPFARQPDYSAQAESLIESDNLSMLKHTLHPPPSLDSVVKLKLLGLPFSETRDTSKGNRQTTSRLARVTVYWPEEGDFYTRNYRSSTGVHLRDGHCAVDPKVIPYGSVISVPGVGALLAVDTGSAVVSRRAARAAGRTTAQRNAIVIDVFCSSRSKARALIKRVSHFAVVSWQPPGRLSEN